MGCSYLVSYCIFMVLLSRLYLVLALVLDSGNCIFSHVEYNSHFGDFSQVLVQVLSMTFQHFALPLSLPYKYL
jgi:hypothetical protein